MKTKMNQKERIINYMKNNGSITPMEAFSELGITKLSTRISEMTREGVEVDRQMVKGKNRYNESVSYMEYRLHDRAN